LTPAGRPTIFQCFGKLPSQRAVLVVPRPSWNDPDQHRPGRLTPWRRLVDNLALNVGNDAAGTYSIAFNIPPSAKCTVA